MSGFTKASDRAFVTSGYDFWRGEARKERKSRRGTKKRRKLAFELKWFHRWFKEL